MNFDSNTHRAKVNLYSSPGPGPMAAHMTNSGGGSAVHINYSSVSALGSKKMPGSVGQNLRVQENLI